MSLLLTSLNLTKGVLTPFVRIEASFFAAMLLAITAAIFFCEPKVAIDISFVASPSSVSSTNLRVDLRDGRTAACKIDDAHSSELEPLIPDGMSLLVCRVDIGFNDDVARSIWSALERDHGLRINGYTTSSPIWSELELDHRWWWFLLGGYGLASLMLYTFTPASRAHPGRMSIMDIFLATTAAALVIFISWIIESASRGDLDFARSMLRSTWAAGWFGVLPMSLVGVIAAPLFEEWAFRAYWLQDMLQRGYRPWVSILLTGLVFGLVHAPESIQQFIAQSCAGVALGGLWFVRRNLWVCVLAHALVNAAALVMTRSA